MGNIHLHKVIGRNKHKILFVSQEPGIGVLELTSRKLIEGYNARAYEQLQQYYSASHLQQQ